MRKFLLMLVTLIVFGSWQAMGQCGTVSMIGEFNGWAGDHMMTRSLDNPAEFTTIITLTDADDVDPVDGVVSLKFRENMDWVVNWGSADFPSGTAVQDGDNIPVPPGTYYVMFNCSTGEYSFTSTCGEISLIGEFNGWADDHWMTRDPMDPDMWTTSLYLTYADDTSDPPDSIVELKFRQDADWVVNWGSADFPSGTGVQDGNNIPVPVGNYIVSFNCATGEYNFTETCGDIGIIGEFNGWAADYWMQRDMTDPNMWSVVLSLNNEDADQSDPPDGIVELKFRQNSDWGVNWGGDGFPSGTGTQDGANILVPLDGTGLTTDYYVTFNCSTGEYNFTATNGAISMIGAFNGWNGDVMMNRDEADPNLWKLTRQWFEDSEVKFRENMDWTVNWGNTGWPSGTGEDNGQNIPLVAGTYDVTFNTSTLAYNFVENTEGICSEIGLIGDFNEWTTPTMTYMVRDPEYPSQFTLTYNFTSSTKLFFKMVDGQAVSPSNIWGGTFPCGNGVQDVTQLLDVPGGKYNITFNCESGDFCFERLGSAVIANKVFAINVDGDLSDSDWNLDQNISRIVEGAVPDGGNLNTVDFGVNYNEDYLYVGMNVIDSTMMPGEVGYVFLDGDKSGGDYGDADVALMFSGAGIQVIHGPDGIQDQILLGFAINASGYSAEVAIPWAPLGFTPEEGGQAGFDVIIGDDDTGTGVDYYMAWNGDLSDTTTTSNLGDLVYGGLSCGIVSLYNETIGDVKLQNPTDMPTTYIGTYNLDNAYDLMFRKDNQGTVTWATDSWPTGTATLGGPTIPGAQGMYRISFDCLSGEYNFDADAVVPAEGIAMSDYTDTPQDIDGDLTGYNLQYGSDILVVGDGPNNNTVTWGSMWDKNNLYVGVNVVDANVIAISGGNPWQMDAIEFYVDGNNDKDGTYDSNFDTQLIMDADTTGLWLKADGVQLEDYDAVFVENGSGYTVEMRLAWKDFGFAPGKGRVMGWSLANNDLDNPEGTDRDYQTTWYGTENNWSNTADLGDLELAGGPYFFTNGFDEHVLYNANVQLFPNPTNGNVYLQSIDDVFNGDVNIFVSDISGRTVLQKQANMTGLSIVELSTRGLNKGVYFVNVMGQDGKRAVKKMIVQ